MTPEARAENKPEEEAYRALVEYVAEQIATAHAQGNTDKAFEVLREIRIIHPLNGDDKFDLLRDIFFDTL